MYMSTSLFRLQRFALILLLLCGNFSLMQAQRFLITGTAQEEKTNAAVEFASVALLRPDSTGISAVTTDENGKFTGITLHCPENFNFAYETFLRGLHSGRQSGGTDR